MAYNPPTQSIVDNDTRNSASNEAIYEALKLKANTNLQNLSFSGMNGQVLTLVAGVPAWAALPASGVTNVTASSPLASSGGTTPDISIQVATALQNGYLSSTDWSTFNGKMTNPMTTAGDIVVGGVAGAPGRLALGVVDKILVSNGTTLSYQYAGLGGGSLGTDNIILGRAKPTSFTTANSNILINTSATNTINTGQRLVAIGTQAGDALTSGSSSIYIGYRAGLSNATGTNNIMIGDSASPSTVSAASNIVAIGKDVLSATTSSGNSLQGVVIGSQAMSLGTSHTDYCVVGYQAMRSGTSNATVAIGHAVANDLTNTQQYNQAVMIGASAGSIKTTNTGNFIALGYAAKASDNEFAIGSNNAAISTMLLGKGGAAVTAAQATAVKIMSMRAAGTGDVSTTAATLTIAGSQGTGSGVGSSVFIATSPAGTPGGITPNAHVNRLEVTVGGDVKVLTGQLSVETIGKGLSIKEGVNAKMGTATFVAGTVTVSTTAVASNSRIFLTVQQLGTVTSPKAIAVTARVAGTSFTITSSDNTDTSTVAWMIVDPV